MQNEYNDIESKNLGYYSPLQTELSSYFRGNVIEFLSAESSKDIIDTKLSTHFNMKKKSKYLVNYIVKVAADNNTVTDAYVELFIMSILNSSIPIVVYNDSNRILIIFENGKAISGGEAIAEKYKNSKKTINIRLTYYLNEPKIGELKYVPDVIEVIFFK
jgi:galactose-1-phosphate uridylyltransferase